MPDWRGAESPPPYTDGLERRATIKAVGPLAPSIRAAIHAEAASMLIPNRAVTVSLNGHRQP